MYKSAEGVYTIYMTKSTTTATLPAGTYIVGDPCYAIPDADWMTWLEASDYEIQDPEHVLVAPVNGRLCVGVSTMYGDGSYPDQFGHNYSVDAGRIGLVPVEIASEPADPIHQNTITFTEDIECRYDNGTVILGHLQIETGDVDDEDEDEWDEDEFDDEDDEDED